MVLKNKKPTVKKKNLLSKFLNISMQKGKKEKYSLLIKNSFMLLKKNVKTNPIFIFMRLIKMAQPFCELKSLKIKGSVQRIPLELTIFRQKNLVLKWLILNSLLLNNKTFSENLAHEFIDTLHLQSKTIKMCTETHKTSEVNKIFTQFNN